MKKVLSLLLAVVMVIGMLPLGIISASAAETTELATFTLGANGSASHYDGSSATTYSETVNGYSLNITGGTKMYSGARDAKGNSCLKFGTSSAVGSCTFTVPAEVTEVVISVAKYKANTAKINVNGTAYTLTKASNNGEYDEIVVDTSSTKTVTFKTVSGGVRAMINTIVFNGAAVDTGDCAHTNTEPVEAKEPNCTTSGNTAGVVCADCGFTVSGNESIPALGHTESATVTAPTCTNDGFTTYTCSVCGNVRKADWVDAPGHTYVDGVCSVCGAADPAAGITAVDTPVAGVAYKFGLRQNNLTDKPLLMITGAMNGYYGALTSNVAEAIDTYLEETEGGYYIYTLSGATKQYINVVVSGTYYNFKYEAAGSSVWTLNTEYKYVKTVCTDGTEMYLGTYNSLQTMSASKTSYIADTSKIGVSQFCAWFYTAEGDDETCAHTNTTTTTVDATCTTDGSTTVVCADCGVTVSTTVIEATGHSYVGGVCSACGAKDDTVVGGEAAQLAIFEFGENGDATHKDGSTAAETYSETNNNYTLDITGGSKMYPSSYDAMGNSCLKFGTSSVVGSCTFTVPNDVTEVVIYVAMYKAKTSKISVNGTEYTLTKSSDNGEYDEIVVDTSTTKTVTFTTVSGAVRAMVNTIVFKGGSGETVDCAHTNTETTAAVAPTCTAIGYTAGVYCKDCESYIDGHTAVAATGHTMNDWGTVVEATCTEPGEQSRGCENCDLVETQAIPAIGHDFNEQNVCTNCGITTVMTKYDLVTSADSLKAGDQLIFVGVNKNGEYHAMIPYATGNNLKTVAIDAPVNGQISLPDTTTAATITLGGDSTGWTLFDGGKYLYSAGGTNNNYLKGVAELPEDNTGVWTITIAEDGGATITNVGNTGEGARNIVKFNYGSTPHLFACYKVDYVTNVSAVSIYRVATEAAVCEINGVTYSTVTAALANYDASSEVIKLLADVDEDVTLEDNIFIDLNGFTMTGLMVTDGYTVYGIDTTTDGYTCETMGKFDCVDADGVAIVPATTTKTSDKSYLAIATENGYTFHRFYLGITHISLKPTDKGVGYKALVKGDEMVMAAIDSVGYSLQVEGYDAMNVAVTELKENGEITLRVKNYDAQNFGETKLSASVYLVIGDQTITSNTVGYTLREMVEKVNETEGLSAEKIAALAAWIAKSETMQGWNVGNIYTAE